MSCPSVYRPSSTPGLEVECELEKGHKGNHRAMHWSWNNPSSVEVRRFSGPVNTSELRAWIDYVVFFFTVIGIIQLFFVAIVTAFVVHSLAVFVINSFVGIAFFLAGYTLWKCSRRI